MRQPLCTVLTLLSIVLLACGEAGGPVGTDPNGTDPDPDPVVASVQVQPAADTLRGVGTAVQLTAVARSAEQAVITTNAGDFSWSSSDPDAGAATISAALSGESGTAAVHVEVIEPGEFRDPRLEGAVRTALGKPEGELTADDLLQLSVLGASGHRSGHAWVRA